MKQIKPFHFPKLQNCNTKNICPFNIKKKEAANQGKGNEFKSVKTNKQTNKRGTKWKSGDFLMCDHFRLGNGI